MLEKSKNSKKPHIYSEDEPLKVDFIYPEYLKPGTGSIGITIAPGANHEHGDVIWQRNLKKDMLRLKTEIHADVLVCLVEDFELQNLKINRLPEIAQQLGIKLLRFPLVDATVPENLDTMRYIIKQIQQEFEAGKVVIIHCLAGLGRSGMVAACLLVERGLSGPEAIRHVRKFRKNSLFLKNQQQFVKKFAKNLKRG